jgi:serine/threonine protein kinase
VTIPSHIGQYRILRKIGAGGMGLVFLGEHTLLGRRAAIKTLLPRVAANAEIVERFFNEARATSAISDPGVIQVFDFGYHVDGTAYIVMELLEGEALSARIDRLGKLAVGDALRIARQIASSLGAAHARDIIHRDLKPDNIFLVRDAEAQGGERSKILDFGICKVGSSDATVTQSGAMVGTPVYMSPEQCRGTGKIDHRADIYAFGCLVFHMLTGRPPFVGQASGELIVAHLREEPPPASRFVADLPLGVDVLLLRCLAKDPDERFASMAELLTALVELSSLIDAPVAPVAPVPTQMPLGRGFRSMYDGNLAAMLGMPGHGIPASLRSRLNFAPTPPLTPSLTPASNDDFEADERDEPIILPPRRRRAGVRAALAGVLVVGVVLGLVATTLVIDSNDHRAEAESAGLPIEGEPALQLPAREVEHEVAPARLEANEPSTDEANRPERTGIATTGAPDPEADPDDVDDARARPSGTFAAMEPARRLREAARDSKKSMTKPRARESAPASPVRPRSPDPSPPAAAPSTPSPAPHAPPTVPTEDLYDTR